VAKFFLELAKVQTLLLLLILGRRITQVVLLKAETQHPGLINTTKSHRWQLLFFTNSL
jgi:hypothetical protein